MAQSMSCNSDSLCSWAFWTTTNMSVPIVVNGDTYNWSFTYQYRTCSPPYKIQVRIVSWADPDTTCPYYNYLDSLATANTNAYWSIIYDVLDQATRRIGEALFLNVRLANPPSSQFNCLNSSGCATSGVGYVEVLTFYDKCIEFIDVQGGGVVFGGCPGITYVVDCQSQQCCILQRKMCYDNGTVRVCETTLQGSGSVQCSGNATFTPPGGCNILRRSGCISRCP